MPEAKKSSQAVIAIQLVGLLAIAAVAGVTAPDANWNLSLLAVLLVFSLLSDLTAVSTSSKVKISGSFLALVVAMVFLGGPPAALIGVVTILVGWLFSRTELHLLLNNLFTYAFFPLVCGYAFQHLAEGLAVSPDDPAFYLMVLALFQVALALNFVLIAGYGAYIDKVPFVRALKVLPPVLPSELASAVMAVGVAYIYHRIGLSAIALFGVVLIIFQYLLGQLLISQQRAEELERRSKQLASFQVGMLSALLRTLDLRDQMTARHSAAVARYARAIAERAGMSKRDQELVHIAGLLHDIGKFILPDRILKADVALGEEDWMLIRRHPQQGARVVGAVDGYGPVAEIILAHHERMDGGGYPRGLVGEEIPELARIISVADTYDVMTSRDSYRVPVSSHEAIQELRRVAGTQLDPRFVEIFAELMQGRDLTFRHGEDADFEKELALESRIETFAMPEEDEIGRHAVLRR